MPPDRFVDSRLFPPACAGWSRPEQVPELVQAILDAAAASGASDVHLVPREDSLEMNWRVDGVLGPVVSFPGPLKANIVSRLKVLSGLLTYRTDVPQEGRLRTGAGRMEMRVSTFPTLFGEKAVIRLFAGADEYRRLDALGYPAPVLDSLGRSLRETSGVVLTSGPAGSGKTTTVHACLREIIDTSPVAKNVVTLEDPIETVVAGATQSQIKPHEGFDYATAMKSLLRQDPEVIAVGEIRDRETAGLVFQAALTGHLVLSTVHSGSASEALSRLLEMDVEPFQLRSGLLCVLNQRLVRRLCDCSSAGTDPARKLGLEVASFREPTGCESCGGIGYRGRIPLVEILSADRPGAGSLVRGGDDSSAIERRAVAGGMVSRWQRAEEAVVASRTTPEEVRRVLGFRRSGGTGTPPGNSS
jgi:general secretion pathway protein E